MSNNTPIVWLVYPDAPNTTRSEKDVLQTQTVGLDWWARCWLWWVFFWHRSGIQALPLSDDDTIHQTAQIQELTRLLGGDVKLKRIVAHPDALQESIQHLAPKSSVFVQWMPPVITAREERILQNTLQHLQRANHNAARMSLLSERDGWYTAMANQIRASFIGSTPISSKPKQVVLLVHRDTENWKRLHVTLEKSLTFLQRRLQTEIPTCAISILLNAPSSLTMLQQISTRGEVWVGFLQETCEHTPRIHPKLQEIPTCHLQHLNNSPAWMRILLEQIWTYTGTGP